MRRSLVLLIVVALLITMVPMAVTAKPPLPEPEPEKVVRSTFSKPKDIPNPIDAARLAKREDLLLQGKTAEAAALAKTGKDNLLVILVEFGGSDTVTWNPGDMWDPIGNPDPEDYEAYGDCSGIITEATQFTYTGPLHNQLPRPPSITHRAYNSIWTEDFSTEYYYDLLFGDGVYVQYTTVDGTPVTIDLRGYSLREYYEEQSRGMYTVDGDVVGWVQVPHSEAYYGADACPGGRSAGYSGLADGYFPGGGDLPSDAIDAVAAAYPDFDWAKYDQDGDGVLDRVMFVHAGYGEEDSTALLKFSGIGEMAIWSHSSTVWPYKDIGSTGFKLGPYTMMPENGLTGVFAHEFAHNLGTVDLYAYQGGESSSGFWSIMNDDWGGGFPDSAVPPGLDPWHKYLLGWNDPVVLNVMSPETEVVLGQSAVKPEGTEDSVIINLPSQIEQPVPPASGTYAYWGGQTTYRDAQLTIAAPLDFSAAASPALTFKTWYDIEEGWDFGFVQVSTDGGATWTSLSGTTTTSDVDPDCFFADEVPGYTGYSDGWLEETVDLGAYAGKPAVLLRFRYETDPATLGLGWFIDDVAVKDGTQVLFSDGFEGADKWVVNDWIKTDGYFVYPHYYIAEWRNASGFDKGLVDGRYHIKDFGMLLWYRNTKYKEAEVMNHLADPPAFGAKGSCLLVDAHFEPIRYSKSDYVNEVANIYARIQMRDAAFGLRDTQPFHVDPRLLLGNQDEELPSRPAVPAFHDSLGYYPGVEYVQRGPGDPRIAWFTRHWDASVVIPAKGDYGIAPPEYKEGEPIRFGGEAASGGRSAWYWYPAGVGYGGTTGNPAENAYGVHIKVVEEAADLSWGKVVVWNNTDTFLGEMTVDKETAAPGDVLTYQIHIKDAASVSALGTIEIPIPKGTTFVQGSLKGAQFYTDPLGRRDMSDRGAVLWGGRIGGKTLHQPDANITYQVKVDPTTTGPIVNEAIVSIRGRTSYRLTAETKLPWVTATLAAPGFVGTRAPIRYTITVKNESGATLTGVKVAASWIGPAYINWPNPSSWTIASLAPGETWTQGFTLFTFSTATGQVQTRVEVTHPWIEPATASAVTVIVR